MNVLVVASRSPWPPHSGDRLRTQIWLDALAGHASVTLVAPSAERAGSSATGLRVVGPGLSPAPMLGALARGRLLSLPAQCLPSGVYDWKGALEAVSVASGPFDSAILVLSRIDPWARTHVPAPRVVLDAIDSLGANSDLRARNGSAWARRFWKIEARRIGALEASIASRYDEVVVVNEDERILFGPRALVVPNGIAVFPLVEAGRTIDFAFWGNLRYFANLDALDYLLAEIWPLIRVRCPGATLLIGGHGASAGIRALDGRDGIRVQSPIDDRPAVLRTVKIALLPLRLGTGHSNKALEGAEAGCALVGTRVAFRGLEPLGTNAACADDPIAIAEAACSLLEDDSARSELAAKARDLVAQKFDRRTTMDSLRDIAFGVTKGPVV